MSERYVIRLGPKTELTPEEILKQCQESKANAELEVKAIRALQWIADNLDNLLTLGVEAIQARDVDKDVYLPARKDLSNGMTIAKGLLIEFIDSDLGPVDVSLSQNKARVRELGCLESLLKVHLDTIGYELDKDK